MNCKSQNGILDCSYVDLKDFWKFEVESKFCKTLKIFMTAVFSEILSFWQSFQDFHFRLVNELQVSKWQPRVFSCSFEWFLKVWGWVKILWKIENFHARGPWRNFRFWPSFQDFHFRLVNELQVSKWQPRVFSCSFEWFLEVWGWVKILWKIENFHDHSP